MKKAIVALLLAGIVAALSAGGPPLLKSGESAALFEGFEGKLKWYAVKGTWKDGDSSLDAKVSKAFATEGTQSLEGSFSMNDKGAATFYTEGFAMTNWADYKALGFDLKNPTAKELKFVCALCTGDDWNWQESKELVVKAGETAKDIRFDFTEATWKSAGSEWKNNAAVKGLKLTQRFVIKVFGDKGLAGSIFLDNVRLVK